MKGSMVTDAISTIAVILVFIVLLFTLPSIINDVRDIFVFNSPRIASRDIAGMATITAASTHNIEINYSSDDAKYDVSFSGRTAKVKYSEETSGTYEDSQSPMGIDLSGEFASVNMINFERSSNITEVKAYGE
jgi:hypothetical protein